MYLGGGGERMSSVGEVKKRLHRDFTDGLYNIFSPGTADKILHGIGSERATTLRVNTLKSSVSDMMKYFRDNNIKFDRVFWYGDALIIKNGKEKMMEAMDIYKNGWIYLQSLSSMIPPLAMEPKSGEKIFDMTAAPGSKTTQMSALMKNRGYILANDIDKIRIERLKYNLNLQGTEIAEVSNSNASKIGEEYSGFFDKVLLDAPCSGEGRFVLSNPATYNGWSEREVEKLSRLQKKLFESGYKALKPGGVMVYSTCTLNIRENEEVIKSAFERNDFEILDCSLNIEGRIPAFKLGVKNMEKAFRVLPSKNMEGFFVCKIRKL